MRLVLRTAAAAGLIVPVFAPQTYGDPAAPCSSSAATGRGQGGGLSLLCDRATIAGLLDTHLTPGRAGTRAPVD